MHTTLYPLHLEIKILIVGFSQGDVSYYLLGLTFMVSYYISTKKNAYNFENFTSVFFVRTDQNNSVNRSVLNLLFFFLQEK